MMKIFSRCLAPSPKTFEAPSAVSNTVVVDLHERARVAWQEFIPRSAVDSL
jgi:hypothetical protein